MASQMPRKRGRKRDRYTSNANQEEPYTPKNFGGGVLMVTQSEEQYSQRVALRFVECGKEISYAHDH
jgi:hypothetical protein